MDEQSSTSINQTDGRYKIYSSNDNFPQSWIVESDGYNWLVQRGVGTWPQRERVDYSFELLDDFQLLSPDKALAVALMLQWDGTNREQVSV